jgi:hypothetical protein
MEMTITGQLVEVGRLQEESGADGIVIRRADDSLITIKGMDVDEVRGLVPLLFERITITAAVAA